MSVLCTLDSGVPSMCMRTDFQNLVLALSERRFQRIPAARFSKFQPGAGFLALEDASKLVMQDLRSALLHFFTVPLTRADFR